MRADARDNRDAIISAALMLFADIGVSVPMRAVAQQAGVGIATLYRHFPTKDDLVHGVAEYVSTEILSCVERCDAAWPGDPRAAWRALVSQMAGLQAGRLAARLAEDPRLTSSVYLNEFRDRTLDALQRCLARAKHDGLVRPDVDLFHFQVGIAQISRPLPEAAEHHAPGWQEWLIEVFLRGIGPDAPETLPHARQGCPPRPVA